MSNDTRGETRAHTPGEWEANRYDEIWAVEVLDGGAASRKVFVASVHDVEDGARSKANARLIAAAPAFLAALEKLRVELSPDTDRDPAYAANFAAIIVHNTLAEYGR